MLQQSSRLSQVEYALRGPLLTQAEALKKQGVAVTSLNIGNTEPFGFRIPQKLVDIMSDVIQRGGGHGYAPSRGIPEAIEAVRKFYAERDVKVQHEHTFFGAGVSELIRITMDAFLEAKDEVLLPAPCYPVWNAAVSLAGGVPVYYRCDEASAWNPDIEDLKKRISPKTRAIVVINPNNPTGAVYSREVLLRVADIAARHDLVVMSDEIYGGITYDGAEAIPMSTIARDVPCMTFSGLSKIYRGPGLRLGWMTISGKTKDISDLVNGIYLLCSLRLSAPALPQYVVAEALSGDHGMNALVSPGGRLWEQREALMGVLSNIEGISCVKPQGAFYAFPRVDKKRFRIEDDEQFCADYLNAHHVLVIHGRGFYWRDADHFRIVFLAEQELLASSMEKLRVFLQDYRQESR